MTVKSVAQIVMFLSIYIIIQLSFYINFKTFLTFLRKYFLRKSIYFIFDLTFF
jgi:hypothetical protein